MPKVFMTVIFDGAGKKAVCIQQDEISRGASHGPASSFASLSKFRMHTG